MDAAQPGRNSRGGPASGRYDSIHYGGIVLGSPGAAGPGVDVGGGEELHKSRHAEAVTQISTLVVSGRREAL